MGMAWCRTQWGLGWTALRCAVVVGPGNLVLVLTQFLRRIPIHERVELPESLIPADSRVEIDAKITAGELFGHVMYPTDWKKAEIPQVFIP